MLTRLSAALAQDYGGYLSTYILPAKGENQGQIFSCGCALSPITDFKLYGKGPRPHPAPWEGRGAVHPLMPLSHIRGDAQKPQGR